MECHWVTFSLFPSTMSSVDIPSLSTALSKTGLTKSSPRQIKDSEYFTKTTALISARDLRVYSRYDNADITILDYVGLEDV